MTSTGNGEAFDELEPLDEAGAVDAFFARLSKEDEDAETPSDDEGQEETSKSDANEADEDQDESDESQDEDGSETAKKDEGESAKKYAEDDVYFKVKVGDQEVEVTAKELKRLYGQEAALTRRSQEVADTRRAVEEEQKVYLTRTNALLQRATSKADQFRQIPWMDLARDPNVPKEQLDTLQAMAQQAFQEEQYLQQESSGLLNQINQQAQQNLSKQAAETVKLLGDEANPLHIVGWNQQLYGDMLKFATEMGVPARIANQITDAPTLKLLHMAMQFHKGAQKVTTVNKTNKTPKKIVKTSSSPSTPAGTKASKVKSSMARLARSGSEDDAINAFMARLGGDED